MPCAERCCVWRHWRASECFLCCWLELLTARTQTLRAILAGPACVVVHQHVSADERLRPAGIIAPGECWGKYGPGLQ